MTRAHLRRPGSSWRVLVHGWARDPDTGRWVPDGRSFDVTSNTDAPVKHAEHRAWFTERGKPDARQGQEAIVLADTVFDELVLGGGAALHIEEMDSGVYWVNIGGVHLTLRIDRAGNPTSVFSEGVVDPRDGCTYELDRGWT